VPIAIPVPVGSSFGTAVLRASTTAKRHAGKAKVTLICERVL